MTVVSTTNTLQCQILNTKQSSKYLGVTLTDDLSWTNHVATVAARGNRLVSFLRRNFCDCTTKVRSATYATMVCPKLEYASCVWDPHRQEGIQTLETVQRQATKYACNNDTERQPWVVTSMLENLKWDSLEQRRLHDRLGMLYRIQTGW